MNNNNQTSFSEEALLYYVGKVEIVRRNYPLNEFTLDAYLERDGKVIAIEYDGGYFHSTRDAVERDCCKDEACHNASTIIGLIRVREGECCKTKDSAKRDT